MLPGDSKEMNERIRQLALQARAWVNNTDNVSPDIEYVFYKDAYDKKFAELIVRECADWIKNTDSDPDIGEEDAKALREHFGVEE